MAVSGVTLMEAPAGRKTSSKWNKLFTGFKFGDNKSGNVRVTEVDIKSPAEEKVGLAVSEKEKIDSPFAVNQTQPLEGPPRKMSFAWTDSFRRPSDTPSSGSDKGPGDKGPGSGGRWFSVTSMNPDDEVTNTRKLSQLSVDSKGRKLSVMSIDSSTPQSSRRGSYTPRNAAAGLLNTVTNVDERQKYDYEEGRRRPSVAARDSRRASVAAMERRASAMSDDSQGSGGRRPSYTPRNAANGFMRSATGMSEKRDETLRHHVDIVPVAKQAAPQTQPRQPARRASRDILERHRMQSLTGIAVIDESAEEPKTVANQNPHVHRMQSVPTMSSAYSNTADDTPLVRVQPSTPCKTRDEYFSGNSVKTTVLTYNGIANYDDTSPRAQSFDEGPRSTWSPSPRNMSMSDEELPCRPETPLEVLGFRGAVGV